MSNIRNFIYLSVFVTSLCFTTVAQDKQVIVSGAITDEAGKPVSGACIGLSNSYKMNTVCDTLWSLVDTVYTDSTGNFLKEILVDEYALGIRYVISIKGYSIQNGYGKIESDKVDLGTIVLKSIGLKMVTVMGAVIDNSGNHIPLATVLLSGGVIIDTVNLMNGPFDTVYTNNGGTFTKDIEINNDIFRIVYLIGKKGFRTVTGFGEIISIDNRVNVGTITLFEAVNKETVILGTIIDSETGKPVKDALVVVSSSSIVVVDVDSTHTNHEGEFSIDIEVDNSGIVKPMVAYRVSKRGYFLNEGKVEVTQDTVSLGTIKLVDDGTPVKYNGISYLYKPDNIEVYSFKGRLLYSGKAFDNRRILFNYIGRQPIVILYKRKNVILYKQKYAGL